MGDQIRVGVVKFGDRQFLQAQWKDPVSRKLKTRSTKTTKRRAADRFAAKLEAELQEGRYKQPSKTTWKDFRQRYEDEHIDSLADSTREKVASVFNVFEQLVGPSHLTVVDASCISRCQKAMRDEGRSLNTIKSNLGHLKAAFNWAKTMGLIRKSHEWIHHAESSHLR